MARKPGAGRKPAKNEQAAALITALKFAGNLKSPSATSPQQAHYVWLNHGIAVAFDGVVAAGHPIPEGIAGYPHADLLLDALENTDKSFTLTVREHGAFEITSAKFQALVPALDTSLVIPTPPDQRQAGFRDAAAFVKALETAIKVVKDTGTVAAYSAIKFTGNQTLMFTNGRVAGEIYHGNDFPPVIVPRQFANAVVKCGKTPVGIGLAADWKSLTIWFEDGSWFRTNLFSADIWPEEMDKVIQAKLVGSEQATECPPKLWTTLTAVAPFADPETRRVLVRPGLVRTHDDRRIGAAIEVAEVAVAFNANIDDLLLVQNFATSYAVGNEALTFYGPNARCIVMADTDIAADPEPTQGQQIASGDGWGMTGPAGTPEYVEGPDSAPQDGWGAATAAAAATKTAAPEQGLKGVPAGGLAGDPEYESERQGVPVDELVLPDDAYVLYWEGQQDLGIPVDFQKQGVFVPSEWADSLKDQGEE